MGKQKLQRRSAQRKRGKAVSDTLLMFSKTRERLARLNDELRLALSLVVVDGLSYEEAAARMNIPLPEFLDRLAAARETLGAMVENDEHPQALAAE
jgi:DNA-directed RNA polymerase specialized sigma24 family protein